MRRVILQPIEDYLDGLKTCLASGTARDLAIVVCAFAAAWWVYVPVHELLHAYGCLATGGDVTRLEISPTYGAALLQRVFPFVAVGSEYAGQLKGFDTHGNDWTYLATVALPFVLTIVLGVPLLRHVPKLGAKRVLACVAFGASLPIAFAPFVSITGDAYEMGSIVVSRATSIANDSMPLDRWRSDDVLELAEQLFFSGSPFGARDVAGVTASFLVGAALAFATYSAGRAFSRVFERTRPLASNAGPARTPEKPE